MKITQIKAKKLLNDKKGVFGLSSVQQFFAIILGIALLAYVIVVIMGTLQNSAILPTASLSTTVINESGALAGTPFTLSRATVDGFSSLTVTSVLNATDGATISASNYSVSASGVITNTTANNWASVFVNYAYSYNTLSVTNANSILTSTGTGISGFFGSISPVYGILAILVIILVLIVLVRVVTGGNASGRQKELQL